MRAKGDKGLRATAILCRCAIVAVACGLSASLSAKEGKMDTLSIPPFFVGLSDDTSPVEIEIAGHKMIVPRNYIGSAWFSDHTLALQLFTMYPDFGGVTRENFQTIRFSVGAKTPNVVQITRFSSYDLQKEFRESVSVAARRFGEPTEYDGLVIVKDGFKNAEGLTHAGDTYYVHMAGKEADDIIIHCTANIMNLHNCMIDVKFFDNVAFEYEFFFSHLKDWREIHQRSTALLHGFMG